MFLKKLYFFSAEKIIRGKIVKTKIIGPFIKTPNANVPQKICLIF